MTQAANLAAEGSNVNSSGVLGVAGGGTGITTTPTAGGVAYGNGTTQAYTAAGTSGYYLQSNGTSAPSWSAVTITPSVPSGAVLLFYQSAAPTGYTQVTTLNDYALRIVSGTGGTTAGTTAFSTVFTNQTPTITTSGLSAGATTLSLSQTPSHSHGVANLGSFCTGSITSAQGVNNTSASYTIASNSQGGGGSHTHSISGSATSSTITLNVQYANIILCSKN